MHEEYKAIVDAGFLLQIDDPHLATCYVSRPELSVDQVRRWAEVPISLVDTARAGGHGIRGGRPAQQTGSGEPWA